MRLVDINPYVRFARIYKKEINRHYIVGLDHRAFYCADGKGVIIVGEKKYEMQKGSLILLRAGTPYKGCSHTDKMELYAVNFDMVHNPSCPREPISYVMLPHFREDMLSEPRGNWPAELTADTVYILEFYGRQIFELIISEYSGSHAFSDERCSALLKEIITLAARETLVERAKSKGEQILDYIRGHYQEPLTNELVASHFYYHKNYINAIVKKETGKTLHAYLLSYRISEASALLASGEYSAAEVALRVGFTEYTRFSRTFKKMTGKAPNEYMHKRKE